VSNPKAHKSAALCRAIQSGHTQVAELLYPVSDLHAALHQLQRDYPTRREIWEGLELRIAQEQKQKLNKEIGTRQTPTGVRKI